MIRRVLTRGAMAIVAVVGVEALYAVLRPSPRQEEFDPSRVRGNPDHPHLRIAVLGDSTVTAPGVTGPDDIWVSRVADQLSETHRVELKSWAIGGSMAHDLIADQLGPALEFTPDLVFLSVGANDAIKGVAVRKFQANLDRLVEAFVATGAVVIQSGVGDLGTIPRLKPPLRNLLSRRALRFNAAHEAVAEKHGSWVVPQRDGPLDVWYEDRGLWSADLFHVSSGGHQIWADNAWSTVRQALNL